MPPRLAILDPLVLEAGRQMAPKSVLCSSLFSPSKIGMGEPVFHNHPLT